jgi:chromosome partitioning protein
MIPREARIESAGDSPGSTPAPPCPVRDDHRQPAFHLANSSTPVLGLNSTVERYKTMSKKYTVHTRRRHNSAGESGLSRPAAPAHQRRSAPVVVAFLNKKGGVGKTSCCQHLAGSFARVGREVLLIDADPQASLTNGLIGVESAEALAKEETIACLFDDAYDPDPSVLIRRTMIEGVSFLPGSQHLDPYNKLDPEKAGPFVRALRTFVDEVRDSFDVTIIDCPPTLYLSSWSALVAADFVVVPFQPEDYGSQGIAAIQALIAQVKASLNPRLRLLGYLLVMVDNRAGLHAAFELKLRELYGSEVFATKIPRAIAYAEAVAAQLPIIAWKPRSVAARSINALAEEIELRVERFAGPPGTPAIRGPEPVRGAIR